MLRAVQNAKAYVVIFVTPEAPGGRGGVFLMGLKYTHTGVRGKSLTMPQTDGQVRWPWGKSPVMLSALHDGIFLCAVGLRASA